MIQVVCGVIENVNGEFLACLRPSGKHLEGLWEFPGGKIEEGESATEALVRELEEELSIKVEVGAAMTVVVWNYGDTTIQLRPFHCQVVTGHLQLNEHEAYQWLAPNDFKRVTWAAADLPILEEIQASLRQDSLQAHGEV